MQQHSSEPARTDALEVGLDRAKITKSDHIQLAESHSPKDQVADIDTDVDSPRTSSNHVIESIKQKKHKAGIKIRKSLHIGRASDDHELTTTAIVGGNENSDSRYVAEPPEPDRVTFKDFVHNPIDTVRCKVTEHSNQEFAGHFTAKEVPHGDEVDLLHASEAVEAAQTDAQRLLAIQDLSKLMKERQATYARWTFDRHITKVRPLPRDHIELKPRSAFERYDPLEGLVIDWRAYGQHVGRNAPLHLLSTHLTYDSFCYTTRNSMEDNTLDMAQIHQCRQKRLLCQILSAFSSPPRRFKSSS